MNVFTASGPYATDSSVEPNSPSTFLYTIALSDFDAAAPHPGANCSTLANLSLISDVRRGCRAGEHFWNHARCGSNAPVSVGLQSVTWRNPMAYAIPTVPKSQATTTRFEMLSARNQPLHASCSRSIAATADPGTVPLTAASIEQDFPTSCDVSAGERATNAAAIAATTTAVTSRAEDIELCSKTGSKIRREPGVTFHRTRRTLKAVCVRPRAGSRLGCASGGGAVGYSFAVISDCSGSEAEFGRRI